MEGNIGVRDDGAEEAFEYHQVEGLVVNDESPERETFSILTN